MDARRAQTSFVLASLITSLVAACTSTGQETPAKDSSHPAATVQAKAVGGHAASQTRLAGQFLSASDFTNAVVWYRKAAEQGEVEAQLALASCYLAGHGAARNPQEAARWLRVAATQLEKAKPEPPAPPKPVADATPSPKPSTSVGSGARTQRVLTVQVTPQQLQELPQPLQLRRATP